MPTQTRVLGLRGILDDLPTRGLPIPPPSGRRERVVTDALNQLAEDFEAEHDKAEKTIDKFGLTIEIARLRDKLTRGATTDLQRLLLSTPGVPEKLFNEAVEKQLAEAEKDEKSGVDDVKNDSVRSIVTQLGQVVEALQKLVPPDPKGGAGGAIGVPASPATTAAAPEAANEGALSSEPESSGTPRQRRAKSS